MKIVIVGDADAGKTSLSERFCYGGAPESGAPETPSPTIGASFLQKCVHVQADDIFNRFKYIVYRPKPMVIARTSHCSFGILQGKNAFAAWLQCTTAELPLL